MPTLPRRGLSSSLPTLLSLSKLIHHIPRQPLKRSAKWATVAAMTLSEKPEAPEDPPGSPNFWWKLGLSAVLVLAGGVFAGLTLALMGSDDLNLRVLSTSSDDEKERKAAAKVLRLLGRGRHWVLVVLLLSNVIVNESLPIFLDDVLGGGLAAVIASTTMIVIFGEIIPQAICVRYGLSIGGACAPLVLGMMILFAPIAWPIAKLLDYVLGSEGGNTYKKAELKSFLQFHREGEEPLRDDEIGILNGVLSLNDKHAQEIMTPIKDCLTLSADKILNHEAIDQILLSGFSRIPIHEPGQKDNFIGMLLVKRLITYSPEDEWPVSKFPLLPLPEARPDINCFQALDYFQTGRAHLLLISETPGRKGGALGIVSLEDLIEEIIGEEIVDETDRYQDNRSHKVAKRAGTAAVMRGIIERQRVIGAFSRRPSNTAPPPAQVDPGMEQGDGLLIHINDGALVAEPVPVLDGQQAPPKDARKVVVPPERMKAIDETSDSNERSPLIAPHGENGVKNEGVEAEVGGAIEEDEEGNERLNVPKEQNGKTQGKDLLGDDWEDELTVASTLAYPTHEDFANAAKALLEKYKDSTTTEKSDEGEEVLSAGRNNRGWEWRESKHKWAPSQGYLYRQLTRYVRMDQEEVGPADVEQLVHDDDEEENLEREYLEEEEEDEAARLLPEGDEKKASSRNGTKGDQKADAKISYASAVKKGDGSRGNGNGKMEKISVEHHITYSKTYHCPQLLIRAWDENGAPLSLPSLLKYRIIHSGAHLSSTELLPEHTDSLMLDPHSPFPLLQQSEHPATGEIGWSVHPCQVSEAVEEVLAAEKHEWDANAQEEGEEKAKKEQKGEDVKRKQLRWLECWMMLTSGVIDLST